MPKIDAIDQMVDKFSGLPSVVREGETVHGVVQHATDIHQRVDQHWVRDRSGAQLLLRVPTKGFEDHFARTQFVCALQHVQQGHSSVLGPKHVPKML